MTHVEKIAQWIGPGKIGTEIGPGHAPIPGFAPEPIYVDCFKEFGGAPCRADYYGHAMALPFRSNSLDFVASSHVLEHTANPVAALAEWYRVLRPGGVIYFVVPDRRYTWDHTRTLTSVEHMLEDYVRNTNSRDATHIDEFVHDADWSRWQPEAPPDEIPARKAAMARHFHASVAAGLEINIHFHTFELGNLRELVERLSTWKIRRFQWEILDEAEHFPPTSPNGVFLAIRVVKGWLDRAQAGALDAVAGPDRRAAVLLPDAQPFAEFARNCAGQGGVR